MRGKLAMSDFAEDPLGLIPAHAGKTPYDTPTQLAPGGSSPRMRGKLDGILSNLPAIRLIPAHAGKTFPVFERMAWNRAHPRACGEN